MKRDSARTANALWRWAAAELLLLSMALNGGVSTVYAANFDYQVQDSNKQYADPGTENWVQYWWQTPETLWWQSLNDRREPNPVLQADVEVVLVNWMNAVPALRWEHRPLNTPDYLFIEDAPCGADAYGCHMPTLWYSFAPRNANYILKGEVFLHPQPPLDAQQQQKPYSPVAGRRGVLAHKVGHAYGLHERYIHPTSPTDTTPVQCSGERTVMDTMRLADTQLTHEHCDGLEGPVQADVDRINNYWRRGDTKDHITSVNGSVGTWRWSDYAWAEHSHYLEFRYYPVEGQWNNWTLLDQTLHEANIGVHGTLLFDQRTIEKTYDRRTYNSPPGWHGVCIWPFFLAHGTFGMDNAGWCVITSLS